MDNQMMDNFSPQIINSLLNNINDTLETYNKIMKEVDKGDQKFILDLIDDDKNHYQVLADLYFKMTNQKEIKNSKKVVSGNKNNLIKDLFTYKYSLYQYYKNLYNTINNPSIKNILLDFIHITSDHLIVLNFLYNKNGVMISHSPETNFNFKNLMKGYWLDFSIWRRLYIVSICGNLNDTKEIYNRLMQTNIDISNIFQDKFGQKAYNKINNCLNEQIIIIKKYTSLVKEESYYHEKYFIELEENNLKFIDSLCEINNRYEKETLTEILQQLLHFTKKEITYKLAGDYASDIKAFDEVKKIFMKLSDYLSHDL